MRRGCSRVVQQGDRMVCITKMLAVCRDVEMKSMILICQATQVEKVT